MQLHRHYCGITSGEVSHCRNCNGFKQKVFQCVLFSFFLAGVKLKKGRKFVFPRAKKQERRNGDGQKGKKMQRPPN